MSGGKDTRFHPGRDGTKQGWLARAGGAFGNWLDNIDNIPPEKRGVDRLHSDPRERMDDI